MFLADFGLENDVSMNSLLAEAAEDNFDMLILGGDFACELDLAAFVRSLTLMPRRLGQQQLFGYFLLRIAGA